jgi:ParB family transcriptional regulator, chromosome partitioning protein
LQKVFTASHLIRGVIEEIDLNRIKPSSFLICNSDHLESEELATSIHQNGLLQPIIVRTKGTSFEIVAGNRRYSACKNLGWRKMLCHIVELNDKESFEFSLTENIQRKTLNPLDEARAFKTYILDFGWGGVSELAGKISKSPSYVCKRLSILDLPVELLQGVSNSSISASVAEELVPVKDEGKRHLIAKMVLNHRMSLRKTRKLVKELNDLDEKSSKIFIKEEDLLFRDRIYEIDARAQQSFDKTITALKIAMSKIASIIEGVEDNWIVYEILMQHKNMLNSQIDLLIKEKKKL